MGEKSSGLVSIGVVARRLGLSTSRVRQLADAGDIPVSRTPGGHRRFDLEEVLRALGRTPAPLVLAADSEPAAGGAPTWDRTFGLDGLTEEGVWSTLASELGISTDTKAGRLAQYAFTEMLNNAIDHSEGGGVRVRWWSREDGTMSFEVADDGVGSFAKIREGLDLPDEIAAIQELSKGKVTTDPERHTGQGVFFTSRAADRFEMSAGGLTWTVDNVRRDTAIGRASQAPGTTVRVSVDPATGTDHTDVFRRFSSDHAFDRSHAVVKLFEHGTSFVSRSEAKRLVAGLERFGRVEVDFSGVETVGQGFVDEVFRVWARQHPGTELVPSNMIEPVRFMVERGLPR